MTTYNTGNSVPSTDVRDLYDNAENLDNLVNGSAVTYPDRLGVARKSWAGMENDFQDFLISSGYEFIGDYDSGPLLITTRNQIFSKDGEYWRAAASLTLPYTTINNWAIDESNFVSVGDAVLRQDLADASNLAVGGSLVGRAIRHINSLIELRSLAGRYDGDVIYLRGRTTALPGLGEGDFVWRLGSSSTDDDGYWIGANPAGRWERSTSPSEDVDTAWFGAAVSNDAASNTTAIQAAISRAISLGILGVRLPGKGYYITNELTGVSNVVFRGDGAFFYDYKYPVVQEPLSDNGLIALPAEYSWYPGKIYANGVPGYARQTADVEQMWLDNEVQGIIPVYVSPTGNDANNGSQPNSPVKTLTAAIAKPNVGVIYMAPGNYYGAGIGTAIGVTVSRDIEIRSLSGGKDVFVRTGPNSGELTWTLNTGATYEAVPGVFINQVFDGTLRSFRGDPFRLTERTSIATVNANPGSWWYDPGTGKIYVRMPTDRTPSGDSLLFGSSTGTITGNRGLFCKGIMFEGGGLSLVDSGGVRPRLYMVDSGQRYAANNGIASAAGFVYLQRCTFALSGLDNLNYHDNGVLASRALEIDCISYGSGYKLSGSPAENNNASSMHDTGVILRINGEYSDSWGPVLPDTGTSTSWNIGVKAERALCPTTTQNVSFYAETSSTLIDCQASQSAYDLRVGTGGVISVRNPQTAASILREGTGKIQQI